MPLCVVKILLLCLFLRLSLSLSLSLTLSLSQQTPLHTAAKYGNDFTMKDLVNLGALKNIKDKDGVSKIIRF